MHGQTSSNFGLKHSPRFQASTGDLGTLSTWIKEPQVYQLAMYFRYSLQTNEFELLNLLFKDRRHLNSCVLFLNNSLFPFVLNLLLNVRHAVGNNDDFNRGALLAQPQLPFTFLPQPCGARLSSHQKHNAGKEKATEARTNIPALPDSRHPDTSHPQGFSVASQKRSSPNPQAGASAPRCDVAQAARPEALLSASIRSGLLSSGIMSSPAKEVSPRAVPLQEVSSSNTSGGAP